LASRTTLDSKGKDEIHYIDPLDAIVERGQNPAGGLLEAYHGYRNGDIDALTKDCMY
jgi:gamma-glutamylcysteine synthetase